VRVDEIIDVLRVVAELAVVVLHHLVYCCSTCSSMGENVERVYSAQQ
jgi:surface polysaccharide O-acyltransferase-like enzyme